jgi:carboxyl-terminal processing protease
MPKSLKISLLAISVVFVLCLFLGVNTRGVSAAGDQSQEGAYRQINVYGEVLQHVQNDYVEDPNIPAVTNGALRGLLENLDADSSSSYLSPTDYKIFKEDKGGKAQVGINVSKRYGYATVVSVVPGSPADKANLNDGDIIEAVGNQDTRDLSRAVIERMLEGAPGSELDLAVIRPRQAKPQKVVLNRAIVSEPPVGDTLYDNSSILYLKPYILDKEHVNEIESKLHGMSKTGTKKVLLDLRDVSAGDDAEATRLANFFLQSGTIATLEGQKVPKQTFTADPSKTILPSGALAVLINRGTAGPAEIVAAAIADNKRGDLVGERTFGQGSQQKTFELPDGGAIILSVAKYASPKGKKFEEDAVTPTTQVASNLDLGDNDSDTDNASKAPAIKQTQPDDQLSKALEMLKAKSA